MPASVAMLATRALRRLGVAIVPEAQRPALSAVVAAATIGTNMLVELGVIAADEVPSPADQALAVGKVQAIHDAMVAQGFVPWGVNAIPQAVSEEYTKLAALFGASSFGKQGDPQLIPALEQRVRRVAMVMRAPDEAEEAIMAIHQHLTATGLARWSVFDIPESAEMPYVMLAANKLAPTWGMQPNPADDVTATRALFQIVALESSGERVRAEFF